MPIIDPIVRRTVGLVERRIGRLSRAAAALRKIIVDEMALLDKASQQLSKLATKRKGGYDDDSKNLT